MPSFVALTAVPQLSLARDRAAAWRRAGTPSIDLFRAESDGWLHATVRPKAKPIRRRLLELLIDRVEAAIESGRLELVEDAADVDRTAGPSIHTVAYGEILAILFEEEFRENPAPVTPTETAPKTPARMAVYRGRGRAGQPIQSRLDSSPGRDEKLALRGGINRNGSGVRIVGWQHDEAEEEIVPEELLNERDAAEIARRRGKRR